MYVDNSECSDRRNNNFAKDSPINAGGAGPYGSTIIGSITAQAESSKATDADYELDMDKYGDDCGQLNATKISNTEITEKNKDLGTANPTSAAIGVGASRKQKPGRMKGLAGAQQGAHYDTRAYHMSLNVKVDVNDAIKNEALAITYRINKAGSAKHILSDTINRGSGFNIEQEVQVTATLAQDFVKHSMRYSAYTADHSVMDLSAIIEQAAAAVSVFANNGALNFDDVCAGREPDIYSLQLHATTSSPSTHCVYVPHDLANPLEISVVSAIIACAAGCGATVVTDMVPMNPNTMRPMFTKFNDGELAMGCFNLLSVLAAIYEHCGAGDIYALAFTRGVHRAVSVVGHTDEGAWFRKVLRCNYYSVPYGGISRRASIHMGIPRPNALSVPSFRKLVDSIAIWSAAAVAECDPGVVINGKVFPIVTTARAGMRGEHLTKIREVGNEFARMYIDCLVELFMFKSCSYHSSKVITMAFSSECMRKDRHLDQDVIAPFYWVEPTGIIRRPIPGVSKRAPTIGVMWHLVEGQVGGFDDVQVVEQCATFYVAEVEMTTTRASPLLSWLSYRPDDGLVNVSVLECDVHSFLLTGAGVNLREWVADSGTEELVSWNRLMWRRGDNPLPKPAEAMYIGGSITLTIQWLTEQSTTAVWHPFGLICNGLPRPDNIHKMSVQSTFSRLCVKADITGVESSMVNRAATRAVAKIQRILCRHQLHDCSNLDVRFRHRVKVRSQRFEEQEPMTGAVTHAESVGARAMPDAGEIGEGKRMESMPYVPEPIKNLRGPQAPPGTNRPTDSEQRLKDDVDPGDSVTGPAPPRPEEL